MYQQNDKDFIDYQQYRFGSLENVFRGPRTAAIQPYIVFLGGAQTFGRFVRTPFPALLQDRLKMNCINLGVGGGGPEFFLADCDVLQLCQGAEACVIQVMSGRSVSNGYYIVDQKRNAVIKEILPPLHKLLKTKSTERRLYSHDVLTTIVSKQNRTAIAVIGELRRAWVAKYLRLLEQILTKRLLFWFSERRPEWPDTYASDKPLMKYPQLVNKMMIEAIVPIADEYVECVSSDGLPQSLLVAGTPVIRKHDGGYRTANAYYPSPEMHLAAADALEIPIRKLLLPPSAPRTRRTTSIGNNPAIVHCHIQKTAGSALNWALLYPNFTEFEILRFYPGSGLNSEKADLGSLRDARLSRRLIAGHVPYGFGRKSLRNPIYVSLFREPSRRFISAINFMLNEPRHHIWKRLESPCYQALQDGPDALARKIIKHTLETGQQSNVMTRCAAGLKGPIGTLDSGTVLRRALTNIRRPDYLIGISERFDEFCSSAAHSLQLRSVTTHDAEAHAKTLPWWPGAVVAHKRWPAKISPKDLSSETIAMIEQVNDLDSILYQNVLALLNGAAINNARIV